MSGFSFWGKFKVGFRENTVLFFRDLISQLFEIVISWLGHISRSMRRLLFGWKSPRCIEGAGPCRGANVWSQIQLQIEIQIQVQTQTQIQKQIQIWKEPRILRCIGKAAPCGDAYIIYAPSTPPHCNAPNCFCACIVFVFFIYLYFFYLFVFYLSMCLY